jgi:uncharacterized membrane protein
MTSNFAVLVSAWFLIIIGLIVLLVLIPYLSKCFKGSEARTEFFSARVAYWCVIAGLVLIGIVAVGLVAEDFAAVMRRI